MQDFFLGRQPIFDREMRAVAYELLFRRGDVGAAGVVDQEEATTQVVLNTFVELGLERVVDQGLAFVNVTRAFLVAEEPFPFPKGRVVFEVLEDIEPDPEVIAGVERLAAAGHLIALDDFLFHERLRPLVERANIVKIDLLQVDEAALRRHVAELRRYNLKLLAEKVETHEQFELCYDLGFDYFQGYFLSRPHIIKGQRPSANRLTTMTLLAQLQDPDVEIAEVSQLIGGDVGLSYRLLKLVNSAFFSLPRKVESLRQAVNYLGLTALRRWIALLVTAAIDKPGEQITTALVRARMCELLAERRGVVNAETYFTVGLFSSLDALMDMPLAEVLAELPLTDEVSEALLHHRGPAGEVLVWTLAYERCEWDALVEVPLEPHALSESFLLAVAWADAFSKVLATDRAA